ncbi:hypothetical protein FO519_005426 [Halicephalobus sp. NKZ332]|nr:hypothetical protein FO519_005426 [Halicephalobus sp. NKZ332]
MLPFIFILTVFSSLCFGAEAHDPELNVDTRDWVDPNDPFEITRVKLQQNCDCGEELENYKNTIYQQETRVKELESRLLKKHENFTKLLLSDIFHGINIDVSSEDYVFKRGDVTLTKNGIKIIRRFFSEPEPNDVLKASLQLEMKAFLSEIQEARENPIFAHLRGLAPYLVGANVIIMVFVIFHYGIFRNRKTMLLILFCGLYVAEVSRTVNMKYKEAMAKRIAQDNRRTENPCYPKGYFSTAMDSFSSMFFKVEDDCYKFYRDSMVDVELDVKILGSAFSVLGETAGSFFVGLFRAIREAVEDYFSPAPIYVQIIKMFIFIVLVITVIILTLKFCEFEIQNPLLRVRWKSVSREINTLAEDLPVLKSPNITPRSEARMRNLNPNPNPGT